MTSGGDQFLVSLVIRGSEIVMNGPFGAKTGPDEGIRGSGELIRRLRKANDVSGRQTTSPGRQRCLREDNDDLWSAVSKCRGPAVLVDAGQGPA